MKYFTAVAAVAFAALAGTSQAAVSSFTSNSAFETACGTLEHVSFDHFWDGWDVALRPDFMGEIVGTGGVLFRSPSTSPDEFQAARETDLGVRAVPPEFYSLNAPYDSAFVASTFGNPLMATLQRGVFSFGGHFGVLNGTPSAASLSLYHGTTMLHRYVFNAPSLAQGQPGNFVGFVSDQEITSVHFDAPDSVEAVSDLSLGSRSAASPSPVPLPAGLPLLLSALGGAALLRRRG